MCYLSGFNHMVFDSLLIQALSCQLHCHDSLETHCLIHAVGSSTARVQESALKRLKHTQAFGVTVHLPELHS